MKKSRFDRLFFYAMIGDEHYFSVLIYKLKEALNKGHNHLFPNPCIFDENPLQYEQQKIH